MGFFDRLNATDHQCKRLPQNLKETKKVVKPQPLKKAPAFCIWCIGLWYARHGRELMG
jgi:hypothetical protein